MGATNGVARLAHAQQRIRTTAAPQPHVHQQPPCYSQIVSFSGGVVPTNLEEASGETGPSAVAGLPAIAGSQPSAVAGLPAIAGSQPSAIARPSTVPLSYASGRAFTLQEVRALRHAMHGLAGQFGTLRHTAQADASATPRHKKYMVFPTPRVAAFTLREVRALCHARDGLAGQFGTLRHQRRRWLQSGECFCNSECASYVGIRL